MVLYICKIMHLQNMKCSENMKVAKVIIIILDIIITPLLLVQIIGGNYNISGISIMLL